MRARDVAGAADGRPRHPLVGARDRLPRRHRGVAAEPGGALRGQHQRHGPPRRRPRPDTCARCTRWACGCSATSRRATGATPASPTTWPRAWRGAMSAARDFVALMRKLVAERGLPEPELPDPEPLRAEPLLELDLDGFGAVILTAGYRPDYARWVDVPGAFDALGFPLHEAGASRPPRRGCGSPACTSCAGAARRCSAGSATTPRWWPAGSPRRPSRRRSRSPRGSRARGTRAGARPRSRPTRRPSAGTPRGRRA